MFKKIFLLFLITFFLFPNFSLAITCQEAGGSCENDCSKTFMGVGYTPCPNGKICCDLSSEKKQSPQAQEYKEGSTGGFLFLKGHLVPCGRQTDDIGTTDINETNQCTLCHLFIMLKNIFDLMLSLLIIAAILFITIGGIIYIVSAGNSNMISLAKNIIKKTLIGFALMLVGWLLVYTLLIFLSTGENGMIGSGGRWYQFDCDLESNFQAEEVSENEISNRSLLAKNNISINKPFPATQVAGLNEETIQDLISFQRGFGSSLVVTGGSESSGGHASGTASHGNGQKVDLRLDDSLDAYIKDTFKSFKSSRTDVSAAYTDEKGNYYYLEDDHWDVCFGPDCKQI